MKNSKKKWYDHLPASISMLGAVFIALVIYVGYLVWQLLCTAWLSVLTNQI